MSASSLKSLASLRGGLLKLYNTNIFCSPARNYWRRSAFSELSSAMQTIENRMRDMDRDMNRLFNDIQSSSPFRIPRLFSPFESSRDIPVVAMNKDDRSYRLELDMHGMEPENINVTLKNHELTITAKREEKKPDGSRMVRENTYHYTLPEEVNPEVIRSSLSNGVLTIEAPLPALESKEIPVKIEGSSGESSDPKKQ
ncbi:hypothetical protein JTE90_025883 [Oedothorax gibbosus]|uniref:SHSP domain-containing protein n=1 Tax=Oedothorax gibbosus TaxID=931172 RepID=A0AAV6ULT1_9ARAC|nr:hypothetical protein JTE90_025883 [Oedothorax gibbosus]